MRPNKLVSILLSLTIVLPALILFTFTAPVVADPTVTSWPSWRGDSRNTGYTSSAAPNTNMTSWKVGPLPYTPYVSGLVVDNNKVFVDLSDGYIKALDEATGVELWEADLAGVVTPYGICVAGKVVVGGGFEGNLYGLNETTGELLWLVDPPEPGWFLLAPTYDPVTGDVYINSFIPYGRGYIYRINPENGSTVWTTALSLPGQWPYYGGVTTPAVDPANGRVFVLAYGYPPANPTYKTAVFAFNITDGQKLWGPVVITHVSSSLCSPAVADGKVFVGDNTGQFFALDEFTGSIVWGPVFLGWSPSPSPGRGVTPAAVDEANGVIAVATANQTLYSLNMDTGEVNWKVKLDGVPGPTAPAISGDGKIVIACAGNYSAPGPEKISVYNETIGELVWSYATGATLMEAPQSPAIADDSIFYSDYNGYVYRFYNVSVVHDISVLNVSAAPNAVYPGDNVSINVTVGNHGNYNETFNVTTYYDGYALYNETVTNLDPSTNMTLTFNWNTSGVAPGTYTIFAEVSVVEGEIDTVDNSFLDGRVTVLSSDPDVAVLSVEKNATIVDEGEVVEVRVDVINEYGYGALSSNVTAKYDSGVIGNQTVTLGVGELKTLTYYWNTTGVQRGSYNVSAEVVAVPGEIDLTDNNKTDGAVTIRALIVSEHFTVHYGADVTYQYAFDTSNASEYSWDLEINTDGFDPPPDPDKIDIYIKPLPVGMGAGTSYNPSTNQITIDVDNSLTWNYPWFLQVVMCHEFFHCLQAAYDYYEPKWISEGTATWMEDRAYTGAALTESFINEYMSAPDKSLRGRSYDAVLYFKFLAERFGGPATADRVNVIKNILNETRSYYDIDVVNRTLIDYYGSNFTASFEEWSVWNYDKQRYEEGAGFNPVTLQFNETIPDSVLLLNSTVNLWGTDYIALNQPNSSVSAIRIEFQGEETPEYGVIALYIQNGNVVKEVELILDGAKEYGTLTIGNASLYSQFVIIIMGTGPPLEPGAPPIVGNYNITVTSIGAFLHIGDLNISGTLYPVTAATNSTITAFNSNGTSFWFNISGPPSTLGWCNLTVPIGLNQSPYMVFVDSEQMTPIITSNGTHYFIYFSYTHSEHTVTFTTEGQLPFVPEFPFFWASILLITASLTCLAYKGRKRNHYMKVAGLKEKK